MIIRHYASSALRMNWGAANINIITDSGSPRTADRKSTRNGSSLIRGTVIPGVACYLCFDSDDSGIRYALLLFPVPV